MRHDSFEDCPCCHECLTPGADTDRALVVAFLGGVLARDANVAIGAVLCAKHSELARECLGFVHQMSTGGRG